MTAQDYYKQAEYYQSIGDYAKVAECIQKAQEMEMKEMEKRMEHKYLIYQAEPRNINNKTVNVITGLFDMDTQEIINSESSFCPKFVALGCMIPSVQYVPIGYKFLMLDKNGVREASSLDGITDDNTMIKIDYLKNINDDVVMSLDNATFGYKVFCTIDVLRDMGWLEYEE